MTGPTPTLRAAALSSAWILLPLLVLALVALSAIRDACREIDTEGPSLTCPPTRITYNPKPLHVRKGRR